MLRTEELSQVASLRPGCSDAEITEAERALGLRFPQTYIELLRCSNGLLAHNDRTNLYGVQELPERNATYEAARYSPGWIMIGDDCGGHAILIASEGGRSGVFVVDMGSMSLDDADLVAPNLREWVDSGLPPALQK